MFTKATRVPYKNNVYTIDYFDATIVLMSIADVSFSVALTDAIVEPLANALVFLAR